MAVAANHEKRWAKIDFHAPLCYFKLFWFGWMGYRCIVESPFTIGCLVLILISIEWVFFNEKNDAFWFDLFATRWRPFRNLDTLPFPNLVMGGHVLSLCPSCVLEGGCMFWHSLSESLGYFLRFCHALVLFSADHRQYFDPLYTYNLK